MKMMSTQCQYDDFGCIPIDVVRFQPESTGNWLEFISKISRTQPTSENSISTWRKSKKRLLFTFYLHLVGSIYVFSVWMRSMDVLFTRHWTTSNGQKHIPGPKLELYVCFSVQRFRASRPGAPSLRNSQEAAKSMGNLRKQVKFKEKHEAEGALP